MDFKFSAPFLAKFAHSTDSKDIKKKSIGARRMTDILQCFKQELKLKTLGTAGPLSASLMQ